MNHKGAENLDQWISNLNLPQSGVIEGPRENNLLNTNGLNHATKLFIM